MVKVSGIVIRGKGKGKTIGFPTINVLLGNPVPSGIYYGRVLAGGREYPAAVYVGAEQKVLEAHLLDFDGDLYGQKVEIAVGEKLRDTERFDSEEELIAAIARDVERVRSKLKAKS
jgi:riboflavin kinase/FMN adenylyltransferase